MQTGKSFKAPDAFPEPVEFEPEEAKGAIESAFYLQMRNPLKKPESKPTA